MVDDERHFLEQSKTRLTFAKEYQLQKFVNSFLGRIIGCCNDSSLRNEAIVLLGHLNKRIKGLKSENKSISYPVSELVDLLENSLCNGQGSFVSSFAFVYLQRQFMEYLTSSSSSSKISTEAIELLGKLLKLSHMFAKAHKEQFFGMVIECLPWVADLEVKGLQTLVIDSFRISDDGTRNFFLEFLLAWLLDKSKASSSQKTAVIKALGCLVRLEILQTNEVFPHVCVGLSDTYHSIREAAENLVRSLHGLDLDNFDLCMILFRLFLGDEAINNGTDTSAAAADAGKERTKEKQVQLSAGSMSLRLTLLRYFCKAEKIIPVCFPYNLQVIYEGLYGAGTVLKLKISSAEFLLWVCSKAERSVFLKWLPVLFTAISKLMLISLPGLSNDAAPVSIDLASYCLRALSVLSKRCPKLFSQNLDIFHKLVSSLRACGVSDLRRNIMDCLVDLSEPLKNANDSLLEDLIDYFFEISNVSELKIFIVKSLRIVFPSSHVDSKLCALKTIRYENEEDSNLIEEFTSCLYSSGFDSDSKSDDLQLPSFNKIISGYFSRFEDVADSSFVFHIQSLIFLRNCLMNSISKKECISQKCVENYMVFCVQGLNTEETFSTKVVELSAICLNESCRIRELFKYEVKKGADFSWDNVFVLVVNIIERRIITSCEVLPKFLGVMSNSISTSILDNFLQRFNHLAGTESAYISAVGYIMGRYDFPFVPYLSLNDFFLKARLLLESSTPQVPVPLRISYVRSLGLIMQKIGIGMDKSYTQLASDTLDLICKCLSDRKKFFSEDNLQFLTSLLKTGTYTCIAMKNLDDDKSSIFLIKLFDLFSEESKDRDIMFYSGIAFVSVLFGVDGWGEELNPFFVVPGSILSKFQHVVSFPRKYLIQKTVTESQNVNSEKKFDDKFALKMLMKSCRNILGKSSSVVRSRVSSVWLLILVRYSFRSMIFLNFIVKNIQAISTSFLVILAEKDKIFQEVGCVGLHLLRTCALSVTAPFGEVAEKIFSNQIGRCLFMRKITISSWFSSEKCDELGFDIDLEKNLDPIYRSLYDFSSVMLKSPEFLCNILDSSNGRCIWLVYPEFRDIKHQEEEKIEEISVLSDHKKIELAPPVYRTCFHPQKRVSRAAKFLLEKIGGEIFCLNNHFPSILEELVFSLKSEKHDVVESSIRCLDSCLKTKEWGDFCHLFQELLQRLFAILENFDRKSIVQIAVRAISSLFEFGVRNCESNSGVVQTIVPILLGRQCLRSSYPQSQLLGAVFIEKICSKTCDDLLVFIPQVVVASITVLTELEPKELEYMQFHVDENVRGNLNDLRLQLSKSSPLHLTLDHSIRYVTSENVREVVSSLSSLVRTGNLGLPSRIALFEYISKICTTKKEIVKPFFRKILLMLVDYLPNSSGFFSAETTAIAKVASLCPSQVVISTFTTLICYYRSSADAEKEEHRLKCAKIFFEISTIMDGSALKYYYENSDLLGFVYFGRHDPISSIAKIFRATWDNFSIVSLSSFSNIILKFLRFEIESQSWGYRIQASLAFKTLAIECRTFFGDNFDNVFTIFSALKTALKGRSFPGKENILNAYGDIIVSFSDQSECKENLLQKKEVFEEIFLNVKKSNLRWRRLSLECLLKIASSFGGLYTDVKKVICDICDDFEEEVSAEQNVINSLIAEILLVSFCNSFQLVVNSYELCDEFVSNSLKIYFKGPWNVHLVFFKHGDCIISLMQRLMDEKGYFDSSQLSCCFEVLSKFLVSIIVHGLEESKFSQVFLEILKVSKSYVLLFINSGRQMDTKTAKDLLKGLETIHLTDNNIKSAATEIIDLLLQN